MCLLDAALNDLRWLHLDVKMTMASNKWRNEAIIKDLRQTYHKKKAIDGIEFPSIKVDEWPCSYNINKFVIFNEDIITKSLIGPPFTFFQVNVLSTISVYPSQLT